MIIGTNFFVEQVSRDIFVVVVLLFINIVQRLLGVLYGREVVKQIGAPSRKPRKKKKKITRLQIRLRVSLFECVWAPDPRPDFDVVNYHIYLVVPHYNNTYKNTRAPVVMAMSIL